MTATHAPSVCSLPNLELRQRAPGWRIVAMFACMAGLSAAATFGNFTYTDNGSSITITGYSFDAVGAAVIPDSIDSKPVTGIGPSAFASRSGLTGVTIPSTVTSIGNYAFYSCNALKSFVVPSSVTSLGIDAFGNCVALTEISVAAGNVSFSSVDGVLFDITQTMLIAYPAGLSGGYAIPYGVTHIATNAFYNCDKLTGVTVPSSLTTIANGAFYSCGFLARVSFLGNAPTALGSYAFFGVASGFAIHHYSGATGFDVSPWAVYTKVVMGDPTPMTDWLLMNSQPYNSSLQSDSNHDGVNLLMAYALNLDPNENLSGSQPQSVVATDQMSLTFYAGAVGVNYVVEVSPDMREWSTEGVNISEPDENQMRTATVDTADSSCFMRLKVSH